MIVTISSIHGETIREVWVDLPREDANRIIEVIERLAETFYSKQDYLQHLIDRAEDES
jgi:hypothetical protein